jgi:hypothetical protein
MRKSKIDAFITAGKYAAAATALLKLAKVVADAYPKVAPAVLHLINSLVSSTGSGGIHFNAYFAMKELDYSTLQEHVFEARLSVFSDIRTKFEI